MNLTIEEIQELQNKMDNKLPLEAMKKLFSMLPEGFSPQMILPMLSDAAKGISENASVEEIVKTVSGKMRKASAPPENPAADSKRIVRDYFDTLLVEMRLMDSVEPSTEAEFFGCKFSSPIMNAALSHLGTFHPDWDGPMEKYAEAALKANVLHWVGMIENDQFEQIMKIGAKTVRIVKPYKDEDKIISQLEQAGELGAVAVGMDIDHTFTKTGNIDVVIGEEMAVKSSWQLLEYSKIAKLPFVIKGVLSVHDAVKCAEIGASAIVVSHHGGRIPYAAAPVQVLPDIIREVGSLMTIIVDCGIESGYDAYKAMALGADGVSVGTHLIPVIQNGTADDVAGRINEMTAELKGMMAYTGVKDCSSFDPSVIHRR